MFYTFNHSSVSHNEQLVTDWAPEVGFFGKKDVNGIARKMDYFSMVVKFSLFI